MHKSYSSSCLLLSNPTPPPASKTNIPMKRNVLVDALNIYMNNSTDIERVELHQLMYISTKVSVNQMATCIIDKFPENFMNMKIDDIQDVAACISSPSSQNYDLFSRDFPEEVIRYSNLQSF